MAPVANGPFPVIAVDSLAVSIQRADHSVQKTSPNCVVKTTTLRPNFIQKPPCATNDHFHILNLPTGLHSSTFASCGLASKEEGVGGAPASFDNSSALLHYVEYYRALDRAKFPKLSISLQNCR